MSAKSAALAVGLVPLALGAVLVGVGFHFRSSEQAGAATVSITDILDPARVPAGRYVSVSGTVGKASRTYGDATVFSLRDAPRLVLVCSGGEGECGAASLARRRAFEGKVYEGGKYAGSDGIPALAIDQFAKQALALRGESDVRVLNMSETPAGDATSAVIAFVFGGLLLVVGLALVVGVAAGVLPRPRRAG